MAKTLPPQNTRSRLSWSHGGKRTLAAVDLNPTTCAGAATRLAAKATGALRTRSFRCAVHVVRTHPPLIRFPGRLPHPRKGPVVRTATDLTYDVECGPDGTLTWSRVGQIAEGEERSGRWKPRDPEGSPPDEGDALAIVLAAPASSVWEPFCRELSIDADATSFRATLWHRKGSASLDGSTAGTEGSHRVGRYADRAPVRGAWSAHWTWSKDSVRLDLRSAVSHGAPRAVGLEPSAFHPVYVTNYESRIVLTRRPVRR